MAFLRSIRLRGFKTFARSTELVFEPGITVLIGPNGSGKSNVADSVLWALGEQSPSSIRSRTMQDVIFSGSDGQRAGAVAEVDLSFDNSTGRFPIDFAEVEISRRLLRDGSSEYRLNGSVCRLLDIQELVAAVGLGREMHSVISQGRVEELVVSTPSTRRALVEEAAGLGRYKKRRDRTQAKLEKVRVNVDRVAAVEREVRSVLRPLKMQVTAAERHAALAEELAQTRAKALLLELVELRIDLDRERGEARLATERRQAYESELTRLREERSGEESRFAEALSRREQVTARYHQTRAEVERVQTRAATLRQRIARLDGELARADRRRATAEAEVTAARARLASLGDDPGATGTRLAWVEAAAETIAGRLSETRPALAAALADEDGVREHVFELEAGRSRLLQERDFLQRELDELSRRQETLTGDERAAAARAEGLTAALSETRAAALAAERAAEAAVARASEAQAEAARQAHGAREAQDDLRRAEEEAAAADSRVRVLKDLVARREGVPAAAKAILGTRAGAVLVTDLLRVEPGYERAVAAALGPLASAVVVPAAAEVALVNATVGPVEILWPEAPSSRSPAHPFEPPAGTRLLLEVLGAPPALEAAFAVLLPPTVVLVAEGAESLSEGSAIEGARVVTRGGEIVQGGLHAARRTDAAAETALAAQAELTALEGARRVLSDRLAAAAAAAEAALEARGAALEQLATVEADVRTLQTKVAGLRDEVDLAERRLTEAQNEVVEVGRRLQEGVGLASRLLDDTGTIAGRIANGESELDEARGSLRRAREAAERLRGQVAALEGKRSQAALLAVRLRERLRAWKEERDRVVGQLQTAERAAEAAARRGRRLLEVAPVLGELYEVTETLGNELAAAVAGMEAEVNRSRMEGDRFGDVLREHGVREADAQRSLAAEAERVVEVEVALAHLADRVEEREHDLAELRRRHLAPRGLTETDVAGASRDGLAAAAQRLQSRLEGIGPVNPLAEQEYRETAERAEFLAEQRRDLEASLLELEQVIAELDEHILCTFDEVFASISVYFKEMVEVLFPGGKGVLRLVEDDPVDLTEGESDGGGRPVPGIALEIKPPRKAPRSMSLLSGGEKALAAIAFLFALFLARPCPFYILDEVEAALDDTNLSRFLSVIRRYQDMTQFIVITHQRRTMEIADTLYGVAMDADGTSRVLSRRLTPIPVETEGAGAD